jgi:hypothetical protein
VASVQNSEVLCVQEPGAVAVVEVTAELGTPEDPTVTVWRWNDRFG